MAGTGPALAQGALLESYDECMRVLARHEDVRTIVLGGAGFTGEIPRLNPGIEVVLEDVQVRLRESALRYRFDWLDHEDLLGGGTAKLPFFHPDGMHTDERSQRLVTEAIAQLGRT